MRLLKKILLVILFSSITLFLGIYIYAFFAPIDLLAKRNNITIYDCNESILYESNFKRNMEWTPLSNIPKKIQNAFLCVEDKRFYYHPGFDPIRITKAVLTNLIHGKILQGGSTITQQYAKNLFLTNEQSITRKIKEFIYSAQLEMHYDKSTILEGYLNTVYFGHGIYGINSASHFFFNKKLSDLNNAEIAMLVGIPNGPSVYSPLLNKEHSKKRQSLVLSCMLKNNLISKDELQQALQTKLKLSSSILESPSVNRYYIDATLAQLKQLQLDATGPLEIYTNYDPNVQAILDNSIKNNLDLDNDLECAGIIVQPFTSNILAIAGGKDYTISQYNRAIYSKRQVASTIKPLLYYCALENGFTPSTQFLSQKTTFQLANNETYSPSNYNDNYANKKISMIHAIATSDNIYAVKTHLFLGIQTLHDALQKFDIPVSAPLPSDALGTIPMSLLEISRIYTTLASEGLYQKPSFISSIESNGKTIYKHHTNSKQLFSRDHTLILSQMLTSPFDNKNVGHTFPSMYGYQCKPKIAIKTGTSNWDSLEIGYTPEYLVEVWAGFDDNRQLDSKYYHYTKNIFCEIFNDLYKNKPSIWYQPSNQITEIKVDPISGEPSELGSVYWFHKNTENYANP